MSDDTRRDAEDVPSGPSEDDDRELTFERGFGANEALREDDDRSLADIAGVTEEDVREDLLESSSEEEAKEDKQGERDTER